ncbi:MAG: hypothetical protein HY762_05600 [Planctomycetes bacterium]|nr:hypothetical protein [Planctomycetota bacterium]
MKRQIPLMIAFVMGILFIIQFFVPHQLSQDLLTGVNKWLMIIGGISLLLGINSLVHFHYVQIKRETPGWGFSLVMFLCFGLALVAGFLPSIVMWFVEPAKAGAEPVKWLSFIPLIPPFEPGSTLFWIFRNGISPFMATMFSMIGFFIASAAFRAFRARSLEATLLLIAAVIIMLGQTPIGQMLWQGIPDIMVWIFSVPNTAAKRAIWFGITMGTIAFSLRIIFGIERAYLGGTDQK